MKRRWWWRRRSSSSPLASSVLGALILMMILPDSGTDAAAGMPLLSPPQTAPIRCVVCASAEYRSLLREAPAIGANMLFDGFCDDESLVRDAALTEPCDDACVTLFEPQFIGGLQSWERPWLYVRGCSTRLFSTLSFHPREIDVVKRQPLCIKLQLAQIFPHARTQPTEQVHVCSCTSDDCNYSATPRASAGVIQAAKWPIIGMLIVTSMRLSPRA